MQKIKKVVVTAMDGTETVLQGVGHYQLIKTYVPGETKKDDKPITYATMTIVPHDQPT